MSSHRLVLYSGLPPVALTVVMLVPVDASDEYVEDSDILLLPVASDRLFTSDADGVISVMPVATELMRCSVVVLGLTSPLGPVMVAISSASVVVAVVVVVVVVAVVAFGLVPEVVAVDIELDDCEEEFSR